MARIFQCDICGKHFTCLKDYYEINRISFRRATHKTQYELDNIKDNIRITDIEYFDICPSCAKAFEKFVEERKKKEE